MKARSPKIEYYDCSTDFATDASSSLIEWLHLTYVKDIKKKQDLQSVYSHYCRNFCGPNRQEPLRVSMFGKIMKKAFPFLKKRRLGPVGAQVSYYVGISLHADAPTQAQPRATRATSRQRCKGNTLRGSQIGGKKKGRGGGMRIVNKKTKTTTTTTTTVTTHLELPTTTTTTTLTMTTPKVAAALPTMVEWTEIGLGSFIDRMYGNFSNNTHNRDNNDYNDNNNNINTYNNYNSYSAPPPSPSFMAPIPEQEEETVEGGFFLSMDFSDDNSNNNTYNNNYSCNSLGYMSLGAYLSPTCSMPSPTFLLLGC